VPLDCRNNNERKNCFFFIKGERAGLEFAEAFQAKLHSMIAAGKVSVVISWILMWSLVPRMLSQFY